MSHLEDTILKIIELKQKGLDDMAVAQNLSLEPETIQLYEKSAKDSITEAMNKGDKDYQKLAEKLQISLVAFYIIKNYYQIIPSHAEEKSRKKRKSSRKITIEKIQEAILQGNDSPKSLAQSFGINYKTAIEWQNKFGFCFMSGEYRTIFRLTEAAKKGLTIQETSRKTDLSQSYIRSRAYKYKIPFKDLLKEKETKTRSALLSDELTRKKINWLKHHLDKEDKKYKKEKLFSKLVRKGLTLEKIGDKLGLTRERIRQKINETGQYESWRLSRSFYKYTREERDLEEERGKLIDILHKRVQQQINSIDETIQWAEKKANEYKLSMKKSLTTKNFPLPIPYEKLLEVFRYYREAQLKGEKLSFDDISKRAGFKSAGLSKRILNRVSLQSLNWQVEDTRRLSEDQKKMVERSASLEMNNNDRAYFMNLPEHIPTQYGIKGKRIVLKQFSIEEPRLTYGLASQIYEVQDALFTREEIIELLDTSPKAVDYSLEHKDEIAPKIINALNILYPEKKYAKPYLSA